MIQTRTRTILFLSLLLLTAASCSQSPPPREIAMPEVQNRVRIFTGPVFLTSDPDCPEAAAVAVRDDGTIVDFYSEEPLDTPWEKIHLPGALALPGLHDAHLHISGIGMMREQVQLNDCRSPEEVRDRVAAWAESHPDLLVIHGRGWDQNLYPGQSFPTWQDLEGATDRPVILRRVDGHASWLNRTMLERAGIRRVLKDPEGGRILKDDEGKPTGILIDNAVNLLDDFLPKPGREDRLRWLVDGMQACADAGLVGIHDMGMLPRTVEILQELAAADRLPLRVFVYVEGSAPDCMTWFQGPQTTGLLTVCGVKLYADGALGSRGALLIEDYSDEPGTRGLAVLDRDELATRIASVHKRGGQVTVHAIGDQANRNVLDAIERAQGGDTSHRHRIEHAQVVHADDFRRFADLGVIASMQPIHCTSDMLWVDERLGADREEGAYAWRTMLDHGVPLAFGSDAPVESWDPLPGIHAAITRQDGDGLPAGGWRPEQRLDWAEAVAAFTTGAAFAVHREHDLGRLSPGFRFDVTLLDIDPRAEAALWLDAKAIGTIVGGRVVEH